MEEMLEAPGVQEKVECNVDQSRVGLNKEVQSLETTMSVITMPNTFIWIKKNCLVIVTIV